ncbi:MAG: hypothetical protein EBU51_04805, partial [Synechococcaceae bacterium WB6_3A_227]|nr:hypothetical protein [Synechococcaceae bacterium WB6_3A_227]
ADPKRVADCVSAMAEASGLPITVKHRIGIDNHDSYAELLNFVDTVAAAGCQRFIVHARKAWLEGLDPKQPWRKHNQPPAWDPPSSKRQIVPVAPWRWGSPHLGLLRCSPTSGPIRQRQLTVQGCRHPIAEPGVSQSDQS